VLEEVIGNDVAPSDVHLVDQPPKVLPWGAPSLTAAHGLKSLANDLPFSSERQGRVRA